MIVTFDGPSASGKSSLAKNIAKKLGYYYLNSGMLYRGLAFCLLHRMKVTLDALTSYQDFLSCLMKLCYCYDVKTGEMMVVLDNENITSYLKTPEIDKASSALGNNKQARMALMDFERILVRRYDNFSVDGRDCGSIVFPQAECKFYITADLIIRAKRWQSDQEKQGNVVSLEQAVAAEQQRDKNDSERDYAPLVIPKGAIVIDTSHLTLEQTEEIVCQYIFQKKEEV